MPRPLALPLLLLVSLSPAPSRPQVDTSGFEQQVSRLADDILGVEKFQDYIDKEVTYTATSQSNTEIVDELKSSLSAVISARVSAVSALRDTVQTELASFSSQSPHAACCSCCSNTDDYGKLKFKTEVDLTTLCNLDQTSSSTKAYPNAAVLDTMKSNLDKYPNLKWQYYGGEDGTMSIYPANRKCDNFDPRYRSWYSRTAFPTPKDLVIVIDRSGSMDNFHGSKTLMDIAKEAAITVLDTLNPDDRVGVASFSSDAMSLAGCYNSRLAEATPENKDQLKTHISGLVAGGNTLYNLAFSTAFKFFGAEWKSPKHDTRNRVKVILFLTDGKPTEATEAEYLDVIRDGNAQAGNKVVILTFGLGEEITNDVAAKLQDIADQNFADASAGSVMRGRSVRVSNPNDLRSSMARYYDFFSNSTFSDKITVAVPYVDAFGLGFITSICLPVHLDQTFRGVTCIDIAISDLFSDATYFSRSAASYAFIADETARLIIHPLLPRPMDVSEVPTLLHVLDIETSDEMEDVVAGMQSGTPGSKTFNSRRVLSRGDSVHDGVETKMMESTYMWTPLDFGGLQLCAVISTSDNMAALTTAGSVTKFPYHRLDLKEPAVTCRYIDRVTIIDSSTVKLAPFAFPSPDAYLERRETAKRVEEYSSYFRGASQEITFKPGVREAVYLSEAFDGVLDRSDDAWQSSVWRYVGLREGVLRLYPGARIADPYDFTVRSWYERGVSQPDRVVFSKPYVDTFGAGVIVTLSRALFEAGSRPHSSSEPIAGVMGMDFTLLLFNSILVDNVPDCSDKSCIAIDDSGYIIYHPDFARATVEDFKDIENVHLTQKEPAIASQLIMDKVMRRGECINYKEQKIQSFWRMRGTSVSSSLFQLVEVAGTNIYIIVKEDGSDGSGDCSCSTNKGLTIPECLATSPCECPCYSRSGVQYDPCDVIFTFDKELGDAPPCTPPSPNINLSSVALEERPSLSGLPWCFQVVSVCPEKNSQLSCSATAGCQWCKGSCVPRSFDACPDSGGNNNLIKIVVPVVVIIVVLIVVGVVVGVTQRKKKKSCSPPSGVATNTPGAAYIASGHSNPALEMASAPTSQDLYPPSYSQVTQSSHDAAVRA